MTKIGLPLAAAVALLAAVHPHAGASICDLADYRPADGLTASVEQDLLVFAWTAERGAEIRTRFALDRGQPLIRDLAVRTGNAPWTMLGRDLVPEYRVTTGVRRMTEQQAQPLRDAGVQLTPEVIDKNRWYAFWDAPLFVHDGPERRVLGGPRNASEIRRATAAFSATSCRVSTDGGALEVTFPGMTMGIFSGGLRFTAYRGTRLLRMDALASTAEPWVAYKYEAGLKGLSADLTPRVAWHDTGGHPQRYAFGGAVNDAIVPVKGANRVIVAEAAGGSLAAFPAPHTFFFTREVDTNLGYVWYRKDAGGRFAMGIRQPDREENPQYVENFALFNAPPGTVQPMGVYFYASAATGEAARDRVLAFTHGDSFKPLAGYKTFVNHFHLRFTERLRASGSLDTPLQDLAAMKAL